MQVPYEEQLQDTISLWQLLQETTLFLWKDWPRDMQVNMKSQQDHKFTMAGVCPHCSRDSAFLLATSVTINQGNQWIAGMQCQGCMKYILAIVRIVGQGVAQYQEHYPLGRPDDKVDTAIPDHIQPDFKEALRCLWVNAYNATAEMCRRALEASCLHLGAPKKDVLEDMVDWLADERKITPFLQQVAHKIRLGGNRGAHPPNEVPVIPSAIIGKEQADAIVKFTREFFHHVYVVPAELDKYDFSKSKAPNP